jgi:hypothetical protein
MVLSTLAKLAGSPSTLMTQACLRGSSASKMSKLGGEICAINGCSFLTLLSICDADDCLCFTLVSTDDILHF